MKTLCVAILLMFPLAAGAAPRAPYSCSVTPNPVTLAYPDRTGWHLAATVPAKADVYAVVTGAGAPDNEYTNVRWAYKQGSVGLIDDAFVTTLFTTAGAVTVQLVDRAADGSLTPITSCQFAVTAG